MRQSLSGLASGGQTSRGPFGGMHELPGMRCSLSGPGIPADVGWPPDTHSGLGNEPGDCSHLSGRGWVRQDVEILDTEVPESVYFRLIPQAQDLGHP